MQVGVGWRMGRQILLWSEVVIVRIERCLVVGRVVGWTS